MCFLYSPVFMEVVCSAKAIKINRWLNYKVFHIFQIKILSKSDPFISFKIGENRGSHDTYFLVLWKYCVGKLA